MEKMEVSSYIRAGEIAREVKEFASGFVKRGMKLFDIAEAIDAKILELGGEAAFPVNLGLNEIAAHFTPASGCDIVAEGILKIDLGVAVDGFIADTAITIDLTEDCEFRDMIALNEEILKKASERVFEMKGELKVCDIGEAVSDVVEEAGDDRFAVIRTLCGHGLDEDVIHTSPSILNHRNNNKKSLNNMAFAVEPFVTSGVGDIIEGAAGGIYALQKDVKVRDRDARKILEFVKENYRTRPFCARWLEKAGFGRLKFVLGMLVKQGVLHEYPILIEKSRKPVSQFENTFVIRDGEVVCTTGQ